MVSFDGGKYCIAGTVSTAVHSFVGKCLIIGLPYLPSETAEAVSFR